MPDNIDQVWPGAMRSAVVLTVDYSDVLGILAQVPAMAGREKSLSVWRYGSQRGVERLLARLDDAGLRTSWLLPGRLAETHGTLVDDIATAGHEIACAGYEYEDFSALTPQDQIQVLWRGRDALAARTGISPTGFRLPLGAWAPGFELELVRAGFTWSSSWRGDDLPYRHPEAGGLIELPLHYELDDDAYLAFNLSPPVPPGQSRIAGYRETLANWQADLDGFHRLGLCAVMRLHPELIGTPGRAGLLRELLAGLRDQPMRWVATGHEVARWWATNGPDIPSDHPACVFQHYRSEPQ
ncbi:polysaccharide deacetylase family protein [Salinicola corii]|uniref:Polysaccharide deacetylase family protein n=1 Tax=Salinicola corii TaxID=2606937 RepID=A0A640WBB6_9GAMM|nr:polysaccharide deacetylase family protein [Salinicola corii]KAA0016000.1 polysaccharide deacetylase family protein [Salinicola corii]